MNVKMDTGVEAVRTVSYDPNLNKVVLIDQRDLPHSFHYRRTNDFRETAESISDMTVRGAGAIGATAAYGFAQGIRMASLPVGSDAFRENLELVYRVLASARPTAVDPVNALDWMKSLIESKVDSNGCSVEEMNGFVLSLAQQFADDDVEHCRQIGEHGAPLITPGMNILTHCNAGWLAFVDIGSATAPMYTEWDAGTRFHVYCDETRPRLQGASLTAWELYNHGVDHTIIPDNAAGHLMQLGKIDMVITGSDRVVAKTGDVANKIGTYTKAVLAHHNRIPFYVAIPLSTLDWNLESGNQIPIETRDQSEVTHMRGINGSGDLDSIQVANPGSPAANYGFDVTPAELITGIITPAGIFKPSELWHNHSDLRPSH